MNDEEGAPQCGGASTTATESPVGEERRSFGIAVIGGPTTVIDIAGTRIVTDPTFSPPGDYGYLRKLAGPAVGAEALGQVGIVLLSHDLHPDNLHDAGRAVAMRCPLILTPPTAAARLGPPARPLAAWDTWTSDDGRLTITAVPARHGPADAELDEEGFVNCEVTGFVLQAQGAPRTYVSGDNASVEIVREIRERFGPVDCAVLHAGAAAVPAKFDGRPLSLTAERAAAAAEVLGAPHVVVAHHDGWGHFREGAERTKTAFESAGITRRLCAARNGQWCVPADDGAGSPDPVR
jgi:L-ascorbate metabolism protein UlaG (beta-lactamase superfamily)